LGLIIENGAQSLCPGKRINGEEIPKKFLGGRRGGKPLYRGGLKPGRFMKGGAQKPKKKPL